MLLFYNLSITLYTWIIRLIALNHPTAKRFVVSRRTLWEDLRKGTGTEKKTFIWIHVASLGEYEQGKPIVEHLERQYPEKATLITFYSPSGYKAAINARAASHIYYLPIDTKHSAQLFLDLVRPDLAIFIKYEYWYHFMTELHVREIPLIIASAIFRRNQFVIHPLNPLFRKALSRVTYFMVQDAHSKSLLNRIGIQQVSISGDTRYDRVYERSLAAPNDPKISRFTQSVKKTMTLGSIWPSDWKLLKRAITEYNEIQWIIVPHDPEDQFIAFLQRETRGVAWSAYDGEEANILILDHVGLLNKAYACSDYAYVGGALRGALHNILEPASFGLAIAVADHSSNQKFAEYRGMEAQGLVRTIQNDKEFRALLDEFIANAPTNSDSSQRAKNYILEHTGATKKIAIKVDEYLS